MTGLIIFLILLLIAVIIVQVGRVSELAGKIRGEEDQEQDSNNINATISVLFMVLFLIGCVVSAYYYKDVMLGYGPHESATEHGATLDYIFNVTLFFTGIVFVITQFALFWFAYKFRGRKGRKALFLAHDNRLEVIWTVIPAVVMTFLVVGGLDAWNEVMADIGPDEEHIEIEATGMQFAWMMRYPGKDGLLGERNYKMITPNNPIGQDFTDPKNWDDGVSTAPGEVIKVPLGKTVRVRILARDVLHNFDIPHFRVKMDAIPGIPTYFKFTATTTTEEYRRRLGSTDKDGNPLYPEWWELADPTEPDGPLRWEAFQFELACAELCGNGHYSMRRVVEVVEEDEWQEWFDSQTSYYETTIRHTAEDPYNGYPLPTEAVGLKKAFNTALDRARAATLAEDKIVRLKNLQFATGSSELTGISLFELDNVVEAMSKYPNMSIEIGGHTDNTGDAAGNQVLSQQRAQVVVDYLTSKNVSASRYSGVGFGQDRPIADNATDEGRQENRRTEFKIINQ